MANSYVEYTISNTSQTAYSFNKDFLVTGHIKIYYNGTEWSISGGQILSITGSSGAATVNLDSSVIPTTSGALLRIERQTPRTNANRLVDWTDSAVITSSDLDTACLQSQYIAEEIEEQYDDVNFKAATVLTFSGTTIPTTETILESSQPYAVYDVFNPFTYDATLDCIKVTRPCKVLCQFNARFGLATDASAHNITCTLNHATSAASKSDIMAGTAAFSELVILQASVSGKEGNASAGHSYVIDCSSATVSAPICIAMSFSCSTNNDVNVRYGELALRTI